MGEFVSENLLEVLGFVFVAGTVIAGLKYGLSGLSSKIDDQTAFMQRRFDALEKKDDEHDLRLNLHENRLTRVETQIEHQKGWLKEMRDQMSAIYTKIMGG